MHELSTLTKSTSFRVKWLFMSSEEKYAYLRGKTRKTIDTGRSERDRIAIPVNVRK
jgi:hypothetical protein